MLERFNRSPRFQALSPGIGLFLVLLGAIVTAAGVTWMRGGEAEAQISPITIDKHDGVLEGNLIVWRIEFSNTSQSSEVVQVIDGLAPDGGSVFVVGVWSGDQNAITCPVSSDVFIGCTITLAAGSAERLLLGSTLPPAQCEDVTIQNNVAVFFGGGTEVHVTGSPDTGTYLVPGDPGECDTPTPVTRSPSPSPFPSPTPTPTVCDKCSTPPPTFPPGIIATPIPTNTPIPPPPTPTNTTVPVATQSGGLTDEQRTQTAVAGARTAAALVTPLPPRTGEGSQGAAQTGAMNIGLVFGGLVILAAGLGVLGTRSRKAR